MEVEDIFGAHGVLREVSGFVKYIYEEYGKHKTIKKEEMSKFLKAASKALRETLRYLGRVPYTRDFKKEEKLSDLWAKVATTALPFNEDLSHRCYLKSSYWANPERWNSEQLDAAKIKIGLMEKEIGKLFGGKQQAGKKGKTNGK